jgi:hypothetical protein
MGKLWYAADLLKNEGDGGLEGAKTACLAVKDFIAVRHENPELAAGSTVHHDCPGLC